MRAAVVCCVPRPGGTHSTAINSAEGRPLEEGRRLVMGGALLLAALAIAVVLEELPIPTAARVLRRASPRIPAAAGVVAVADVGGTDGELECAFFWLKTIRTCSDY